MNIPCVLPTQQMVSPPRPPAPQYRHPEWLTCLWQVKDGMNMGKRCLQSRPRGPSAKRQPSPEGLGIQRQPVERRRCGTTLFVCSLRDPVTFSIFSCFLHPTRCCLVPSTKASSCLPRRAVGAKRLADLLHIRGFMARSRRTRRCLLAGALPNFPATNYREIKNVTSSDRRKAKRTCHGVPWRDLGFVF